MALIECSECGERISDKAKSCPRCGSPVTQLKEIAEELVEDYNLNRRTIELYNRLGGEIPIEEIKSFYIKTILWVMCGCLIWPILLIPFFTYKSQYKPKTANYFLLLMITCIVLNIILIIFFTLLP